MDGYFKLACDITRKAREHYEREAQCAKLEAENARLRYALEGLVAVCTDSTGALLRPTRGELDLARAALKVKP